MNSTISKSHLLSIGLAIFSMLFGAGNLVYPVMVGVTTGPNNFLGIMAFILTAVIVPLMGLIAMILFDGNYNAFFGRIGELPGKLLLGASLAVICPIIAIPRIVTLSHVMTAPFLPGFLSDINLFSSFIFAILFLGITFLFTFRENKIVDILGYVISPLLLLSLAIIMIKGILTADAIVPSSLTTWEVIKQNLLRGYETLDLIGTIVFASFVVNVLKKTVGKTEHLSLKKLSVIGLKAGLIGVSCLAFVYIGLSIIGMFHGHGLAHISEGELFRTISFRILGHSGSLIIATAVLMACFSTSIALSAVYGEYLQKTIFHNKISFVHGLILTLVASMPLSIFGLKQVLKLSAGPITFIGYPVIIALTLCNIGYKLFDFKYVKTPVALTFIISTIAYYFL